MDNKVLVLAVAAGFVLLFIDSMPRTRPAVPVNGPPPGLPVNGPSPGVDPIQRGAQGIVDIIGGITKGFNDTIGAIDNPTVSPAVNLRGAL